VGSGACSLSVLLKEGHLVMANAGDCKVVLSQGGKAKALNTLHRASNAIERQRIQDLVRHPPNQYLHNCLIHSYHKKLHHDKVVHFLGINPLCFFIEAE
jgi:serine/threonine protein phosphatase PrpC